MKRRAPDGFTLLELLLAIVILSLITSTIMGGVHLGRRSWETSRASEALDEVEMATRATATLIAKGFLVQMIPGQQIGAEPPTPFLGAASSCRFVFLSEGGAQWGGLILTEIGVENSTDGPELTVWTKPYRASEGLAPARAAMKKTVILSGLAGVGFSYFGVREQGHAATWGPVWNDKSNLPELVSIRIGANRLGRVIDAHATTALRQQ